jgi:hypothetical protein
MGHSEGGITVSKYKGEKVNARIVDVSPFGKPGGLAMTGHVRNWAGFKGKGKLSFTARSKPRPTFTSDELALIATVAGNVSKIAPPGLPEEPHSAISPSDGRGHYPAALDGAHGAPAAARPEAAA